MDSTQGVIGPNYSSNQAQYNQDSPINEIEEGGPPEAQTLLERLETNHQGHKVEG